MSAKETSHGQMRAFPVTIVRQNGTYFVVRLNGNERGAKCETADLTMEKRGMRNKVDKTKEEEKEETGKKGRQNADWLWPTSIAEQTRNADELKIIRGNPMKTSRQKNKKSK